MSYAMRKLDAISKVQDSLKLEKVSKDPEDFILGFLFLFPIQ